MLLKEQIKKAKHQEHRMALAGCDTNQPALTSMPCAFTFYMLVLIMYHTGKGVHMADVHEVYLDLNLLAEL